MVYSLILYNNRRILDSFGYFFLSLEKKSRKKGNRIGFPKGAIGKIDMKGDTN